MHPCPANCVTIGQAVIYYDQAAQAFSAGIKCRHCTLKENDGMSAVTHLLNIVSILSKEVSEMVKRAHIYTKSLYDKR